MRRSSLVVVGLGLTLAHLALLVFQLPILTKTPGWFWGFFDRPFAYPMLSGLGTIAVLGALLWAVTSDAASSLRVAVIFATGVAIQFGLAWGEGRSLDGLRDRIVTTGHAEFATFAIAQPSASELITQYETRIEQHQLGVFAPSKPPGTLLFYVLTDRLAQAFHSTDDPQRRLEQLRTLAAWSWPWLAMLTLVPLFIFARQVMGDARAVLACAMYVVVPSVQLITLHTDETLFPLVTMTGAALAMGAMKRRSVTFAALAGMTAYLAMFCSFPLGVGVALGALTGAISSWRPVFKADRSGKPVDSLFFRGSLAAVMVLSALAVDRLFAWLWGYDFVLRWQRSVAYHAAWRGWHGRPLEYLHYGLLGLLEFALWLGLPLASLAAPQIAASFAKAHRTIDAATWHAVGVGGVLLIFAVFGETKGEFARLWLFMVPFACIVAADALTHIVAEPRRRWALMAVFTLQAAVLLATKRFQDFGRTL